MRPREPLFNHSPQRTGNSCGAGNDCDLRDTEEVIYSVTLPNAGTWTFSTCGSTYDTYLYIGDCCDGSMGENDDFCGLQSEITLDLPAGEVWVTLEAFCCEFCAF